MEPLTLVLVGGAFAVVFGYFRSRNTRTLVNRSWGEAAGQLGLDFRPARRLSVSDPEISGWRRGVQVNVWIRTDRSGDSRRYDTCYRVSHDPAGPPVVLSRQGLLSVFGRLVGRQDVEVGDPLFDETVVVDSDYHELVREYLTPTRRAGVMDLLETWPSAEITERSIAVVTRSFETNPWVISSTIRHLVEAAELFIAPGRVDEILGAGDRRDGGGGLVETVEELHEYNSENPNAITELREAEFLLELGNRGEAAEVLDRLSERLPADPLVQQWTEVAAAPAPTQAVAPAPVPVSDPAAAVPLDQQRVIDDLFAGDRMSWELTDYFDQTYGGSKVDWTGEVTSTISLGHDRDFGGRPGVRAAIMIGAAGDDGYLSDQVQAVAAFPPGTAIERGTEVRFSGRLLRLDRFGRRIYVEDARL